jgi:DNA polymerase III subunit delta'
MNKITLYPWVKTQWNRLSQIPKSNFPHALIVTGMNGLGKLDFCHMLSQSLLCENLRDDGLPCGICPSCQQYHAGSHGDFLELNPAEGKKSIGVDQIREMINWINLTHQSKQKKILYIPQAEQMTVQASNALLKTLEEPPADVVIILICEHVKSLIATIRSRCQIIALSKPDEQMINQWIDDNYSDWKITSANEHYILNNRDVILSLALNAPLKIKQLLTSDELNQRKVIVEHLISIISDKTAPVLISSELSKMDIKAVIYWFQLVLFDLVYIHYKMDNKQLINKDYYTKLNSLSAKLNSLLLFELIKELNHYYQFHSSSLNQQLLLDSYLIKWRNCMNDIY